MQQHFLASGGIRNGLFCWLFSVCRNWLERIGSEFGGPGRFRTSPRNQGLGSTVRQLSAFDGQTEIFRPCRTTAALSSRPPLDELIDHFLPRDCPFCRGTYALAPQAPTAGMRCMWVELPATEIGAFVRRRSQTNIPSTRVLNLSAYRGVSDEMRSLRQVQRRSARGLDLRSGWAANSSVAAPRVRSRIPAATRAECEQGKCTQGRRMKTDGDPPATPTRTNTDATTQNGLPAD
jgi:hypothetical protein